ncbi:hypothetical protein C1645_784472, partial [Glomus cerebriforme]
MDAFIFKQTRSIKKEQYHYEIENQFKKIEEYRKANISLIEDRKLSIHARAVGTSQLLNPFIKNIPKNDNILNDDMEIEESLLQHVEDPNHNNNEFSDDIAVEKLLLQHIEHPKNSNNEFSDDIAVEKLLLQHMKQLD